MSNEKYCCRGYRLRSGLSLLRLVRSPRRFQRPCDIEAKLEHVRVGESNFQKERQHRRLSAKMAPWSRDHKSSYSNWSSICAATLSFDNTSLGDRRTIAGL